MDKTLIDERFLTYWKGLDFTDWNEADIREEFIAPLLSLLGYSKGTINDIKREPNLQLSKKYHRIGRKKIQIDYVPTVRLKKFWIIEAKPGNPKDMNFGDYLQAHLYAIHPEINVRFIVVTNGWEMRIYDALISDSWEDYILNVTQSNCNSTFVDLKNFLSSQSITHSLQKHILSIISEGLKLEVDVEIAENFKKEVNNIYKEVLPIISQNAQELRIRHWKMRDQEEKENIKNISLEELYIYMDRPTDPIPFYSNEYVRRFILAEQEVRNKMLGELAMRYRGRPHAIFMVQCVNIMCKLLQENVEAEYTGYARSVKDCLRELIDSNLNYGAHPHGELINNISFALCHLDNICARVSYKFCRRFGMDQLKEIVNTRMTSSSTEDLLIDTPSVAREIVRCVGVINEIIWLQLNRNDSREIWEYIWILQNVEEELEKIPQIEYENGDTDLLWFGNYGIDFDMYCFGTWNLLQDNSRLRKLDRNKLPENATKLLDMSREEIISMIPQPIPKPDGFTPDNSKIAHIIGPFRNL